MTEAAKLLRERHGIGSCRFGLILGSGLGPLADRVTDAKAVSYEELPDFPRPGVGGHRGRLVAGTLGGKQVAVLQGRSHFYEHGKADAMRGALETLRAIGCTAVILTNAAGSLRHEAGPGSLGLIRDHIALAPGNPLIGLSGDDRFVDMTNAYDPDLRTRLLAASLRLGDRLYEGIYAWFSGPSFETPAEIRAAGILGADFVGMSTAPETILCRWLKLRVAGLSLVTNHAAGLSDTVLSHEETQARAAKAGGRLAAIIENFLENESDDE